MTELVNGFQVIKSMKMKVTFFRKEKKRSEGIGPISRIGPI